MRWKAFVVCVRSGVSEGWGHARAATSARLAWLAGLALLTAAAPAAALPEGIVFGIDMDQVSFPVYTEPGFLSVTTLTGAPSTPAPGQISAGYLDQFSLTDFRITPLTDPNASTDLWADGHSLLAGHTATLRILGLAPGNYTLVLLSHNPGGTPLSETQFWVNGVFAGSVVNDPNATDLWQQQALYVPFTALVDTPIDIRWQGTATTLHASLNGVLALPEPGTLIGLAIAGLLVVARLRTPA